MDKNSLIIGLVLDTSLDSTDGVPQYVIDLGRWLSSNGHEVHYLVGESHRTDLPNVHSLATNISVQFNGNRTTIPLYAKRRRIKQFMTKHKFDVLHVQTPHHPLLAQPIMLAANSSTAVVATFHVLPYGRMSSIGTKLLSYWLKPSLKRIDSTISVSDVAASFCQQSFGLKSEVIPNMVDVARFKNAKAFEEYQDNKLTILFLGRLVERKGCRLLILAAEILSKDDALPGFRVVICGRGPLETELRDYVKRRSLNDLIDFKGYVSEADKPRYYASADIAVFPSTSGESFGIVLLEAMASGSSAVLAGDNPGYSSVMSPRSDLLFDATDTNQLAEKIAFMLKNKSARKSAADWGQVYTRGFDVERVGNRILEVYNKALPKSLST